MALRIVMLAFAALSLAACQTATIEDTSVRRGASPTLGKVHRGQIRGPIVADTEVAPARARSAAAARHRSAARSASAATRSATVVPNPMRSPQAQTTADAMTASDARALMSRQTERAHRQAGGEGAEQQPVPGTSSGSDAGSLMSLQTERVHQEAGGAESEQPPPPSAPSAGDPATVMTMQTELVHRAAETMPMPADPVPIGDQVQTTPFDFGLGDLTIDKVEAMFGGMPFLLIASIAAALVAALGLALRRSAPAKGDEDYAGPHLVENEDYREPYAA